MLCMCQKQYSEHMEMEERKMEYESMEKEREIDLLEYWDDCKKEMGDCGFCDGAHVVSGNYNF